MTNAKRRESMKKVRGKGRRVTVLQTLFIKLANQFSSLLLFSRLPHHAPHREARVAQTEKILHALMLKAHFVEKLIDVPPTSVSQYNADIRPREKFNGGGMTREWRFVMTRYEPRIPV